MSWLLTHLKVAADAQEVVGRLDAEAGADVAEGLRRVVLEFEVAHLVGRRVVGPCQFNNKSSGEDGCPPIKRNDVPWPGKRRRFSRVMSFCSSFSLNGFDSTWPTVVRIPSIMSYVSSNSGCLRLIFLL